MEPRERRQIGGHYTSERDILKVVRALFLDDLREEFQRIKGNKAQLRQFHQRLSAASLPRPGLRLRQFPGDHLPRAAAAGNRVAHGAGRRPQRRLDIQTMSLVDVDAFFGIEISEWPARIAEVAMWLMDHQMNVRLSEAFGQYFVRLPLTKSPKNRLRQRAAAATGKRSCRRRSAVTSSAIRRSWESNSPPPNKSADMDLVCGTVKGCGVLDYVTGWYFKAAEYIPGTKIVVGFVSTNSITQGEQVGVLWNELFGRYHAEDPFRPSHLRLGERSPRQGPRTRRDHWIRRRSTPRTNASMITRTAAGKPPSAWRGTSARISSKAPTSWSLSTAEADLRRAGDRVRQHAQRRRQLPLHAAGEGRLAQGGAGAKEVLSPVCWAPRSSSTAERAGASGSANVRRRELRAMPEAMSRVEAVREHRMTSRKRSTTRELAGTPASFW